MPEAAAMPRSEPDPAGVATWVELRVHGVSGTPPQDMLDVDERHVCAVSSPHRRGVFYQRSDGAGHPRGPDDDGRILEAYHWGGYTERDPGQARWVFLVPFGIVNAAQFMLPAASRSAVAHAVAGAMLRVIALVVTCMAVLGVSFVAMDRLAWRALDPGPFRLWLLLPAALAPVLVLAWLRSIGTVRDAGRESLAANPGADDDPEPPARRQGRGSRPAAVASASESEPESESESASESEPAPGAPGGLGSSYFYIGSPTTPSRTDAPTLRWLHLAVGTALIALLVSWPAASAAFGPAEVARGCSGVLLLLLVATTVLLGDPEELASPPTAKVALRRARLWWHGRVHRLAPVAFGAAAVVLATTAVVDGLAAHALTAADLTSEPLPGINGITFTLVVVGGSAAVVMIAATFVLGGPGASDERERAYQRYAHGTAGALAGSIGMFLAILYTGGLVTLSDLAINLAWPLQGGSRRDPAVVAALPNIVRHIAIALLLTVAVTLVLALVVAGGYLRVRPRLRAAVRRDFGRPDGSPPVELPAALLDSVALGMFCARLKNLIPHVFVLYAATGLVLSAAVSLDLQGVVPWLGRIPHTSRWVLIGAVAIAAVALGLVWFVRKASSSLGLRRIANTVWDVVAFWPRSVHPFVPVAYSQTVVAELRRRISQYVRKGHDVVLAGHSQGSLVSVAALLWVPEAERAHVGLLTFGSQVRQMFARAFPAYVEMDVLSWIWEQYGGRWRNLYRDTDHLAGPASSWHHRTVAGDGGSSARWPDGARSPDLFAPVTGTRRCGPDWRLLDPRLSEDGTPRVPPGPTAKLHRHSAYWTDPDWTCAVGKVRPGGPNPGSRSSVLLDDDARGERRAGDELEPPRGVRPGEQRPAGAEDDRVHLEHQPVDLVGEV